DCCHELLGHMPMLADQAFSDFSQEIGLASLGASDEQVKRLATCYFFSVEFGICHQQGERRAFGAGLLSSIGELKHALSGKAKIMPFDPDRVVKQECLVTTFQEGYFETPSFEYAKEQMRQFAKNIERPFEVNYDPHTQSIEVLDSPSKFCCAVEDLKSSIFVLENGIKKLGNPEYYKFTKKFAIGDA
ncbi:Tryptophan 5-hydroxylase 2, partial [Cichlidogyrus casuarinus]